MQSNVKPIPDGYHTLTPYLIAKNTAAALEFYHQAFGASELYRLTAPDGSIVHAQFKIGDSIFMISEENPQCYNTSPASLGGSPVKLYLFVNDVDSTFSSAMHAGATEITPPTDHFWGDRMGAVVDPYGHIWLIATRIENVAPGEYQSRMNAFFATLPN